MLDLANVEQSTVKVKVFISEKTVAEQRANLYHAGVVIPARVAGGYGLCRQLLLVKYRVQLKATIKVCSLCRTRNPGC